MRIVVLFKFNHENEPAAVTGIEGEVTDIILPGVGDLVQHSDSGHPFQGKVTERRFNYQMPIGHDIDGTVTITSASTELPQTNSEQLTQD